MKMESVVDASANLQRRDGWQMKELLITLFLYILLPVHVHATEGDWSVTLYGGPYVDTPLMRISSFTTKPDFVGSGMTTLAVSKEFTRWGEYVAWELEGQVAKHFVLQDHWELNSALVMRWLPFPWDEYLDTSFAIGDGVSFATEAPELEGGPDDDVRKVVNFLLLEFGFALPDVPHWSVIVRLHHRSNMYGVYPGENSGSNFLCFGTRYTF